MLPTITFKKLLGKKMAIAMKWMYFDQKFPFWVKVENTSIRARKSRSKFCSCTFCSSTALSEKSLNQIARNYCGKKCFTKKKKK